MPNSWIGIIILTPSDEVGLYDAEGTKLHDLLACDGSSLVAEDHPILSGALSGATVLPTMTSPDNTGLTSYKIVADAT